MAFNKANIIVVAVSIIIIFILLLLFYVAVMILKLYDSLTPLDQLLLKCASVLGEYINRRMMQSLVEDVTTREIGLGE